jgi:hypothetical protein
MTNPYLAMCAELAEELVNEYGYCTEWEKGLPLCESNVSELLTRARALLAQPAPEGPTDEELDSVMFQAVWECMDKADELTNDEMDRLKARAALAKWGHQ